ncbi:hypothetical protein CspHIS471_0402650 [Cutaneotrichosporon sp. HIS471]|nr:hypothetical protein CspHIS471_0402650 [Cutaneotrichosporon sp. HIS471]
MSVDEGDMSASSSSTVADDPSENAAPSTASELVPSTSSSAGLDSSTTSTGAVTGVPTSNSGLPETSTTSTGDSPSKMHKQCVRKVRKRRTA